MKIAIVNADAKACDALRSVLRAVPMLDVVWMATDGVTAVAQAQRQPPDLLLMDLLLPRLNGAEATRQIMSRQPCPILVVTPSVRGHIGLVYEAMGHGALDAIDTPAIDAARTRPVASFLPTLIAAETAVFFLKGRETTPGKPKSFPGVVSGQTRRRPIQAQPRAVSRRRGGYCRR